MIPSQIRTVANDTRVKRIVDHLLAAAAAFLTAFLATSFRRSRASRAEAAAGAFAAEAAAFAAAFAGLRMEEGSSKVEVSVDEVSAVCSSSY